MTTKILKSKTGLMNMGGYFKEKTAQIYTHCYFVNGIETNGNFFRFSFIGDSCDECFDTIEKAMEVFENASKNLT